MMQRSHLGHQFRYDQLIDVYLTGSKNAAARFNPHGPFLP